MNILFEAAGKAVNEPSVTIYPEEVSADGYSSQHALFTPEYIGASAHEAMVEILDDCGLAAPAGQVIARVSKNEPLLLKSPRTIGRHLAIEFARRAGKTEGVIFNNPVWQYRPDYRLRVGTVIRGRVGYDIYVDGTDGPWRVIEQSMARFGESRGEELGTCRRLPEAVTVARDHIEHHTPDFTQEAFDVAA